MQREMILFRGATMPKGRMAYLGRFADASLEKRTSRRSVKAMTWMGYVGAFLVMVPGLTN